MRQRMLHIKVDGIMEHSDIFAAFAFNNFVGVRVLVVQSVAVGERLCGGHVGMGCGCTGEVWVGENG